MGMNENAYTMGWVLTGYLRITIVILYILIFRPWQCSLHRIMHLYKSVTLNGTIISHLASPI